MATNASFYKISNKTNPIANQLSKQNSIHNVTIGQPNILKKTNYTNTKKASSYNINDKGGKSYYEIPKSIDASAFGDLSYLANSGGGGGYGGSSIDLSNILNTYSNSAEAQKQTIRDATAASIKALQDSEASQRATLTKALERFQEDTNKQRQLQQSNFNSIRADLEAQAYMANRQAMQSAASRGLGGSGLQQLAQLQNLINEGSETSNLAQSNTEALNSLAQSLSRQEEDTKTALTDLANNLATKIGDLNTSQANKLNEIDANTANLMAQLQYQEATRAQEMAAAAAASNSSSASAYAEALAENQLMAQEAKSYLDNIVSQQVRTIKSAKKGKARDNALSTALNAVDEGLTNYGLSSRDYGSVYYNQLQNAYNSANSSSSNSKSLFSRLFK